MAKHELLENLDLVFDKLNDGLVLLDLDGKILKINNALLDMGGYKREELVGKNAMKLMRIFPLKSLKKMINAFSNVIKGIQVDPYQVEAKTKKNEKAEKKKDDKKKTKSKSEKTKTTAKKKKDDKAKTEKKVKAEKNKDDKKKAKVKSEKKKQVKQSPESEEKRELNNFN